MQTKFIYLRETLIQCQFLDLFKNRNNQTLSKQITPDDLDVKAQPWKKNRTESITTYI